MIKSNHPTNKLFIVCKIEPDLDKVKNATKIENQERLSMSLIRVYHGIFAACEWFNLAAVVLIRLIVPNMKANPHGLCISTLRA